jgi:WD40 repeat protein
LKKENSFQVIKSYFGPITCSLSFGNDLVVIACKENLEIWDFKQETLVRNIDNAHKGDINCLVKMSDGCFASGSNDGLIKIWNIESRKEVGKVKLNEPVTNLQIKTRRLD